MQDALALRHRVIATIREVLDARDFLEIETPYLTRSTPEGARDFLVPARSEPGSFYALPQSPQLFKQLLMVGGLRALLPDRALLPRRRLARGPAARVHAARPRAGVRARGRRDRMHGGRDGNCVRARSVSRRPPPWPRMTYAEAVARFGSDRPDTRFRLELVDLGEALAATEFKVFSGALAGGGVVRGINAGRRELPRSELDALTELAEQHGAKGLVWAFVQDSEEGPWRSPIAKFLSAAELAAVTERLQAGPGDLLLIVADSSATASRALGALRLELARRFELVPEGRHDTLGSPSSPRSSGTATSSVGRRPTTRSRPRPETCPIRPASARARTTWCSTDPRSVAVRSGSTGSRSSNRCSSC